MGLSNPKDLATQSLHVIVHPANKVSRCCGGSAVVPRHLASAECFSSTLPAFVSTHKRVLDNLDGCHVMQGLGKTVSTISLMVSETPPEDWLTSEYVPERHKQPPAVSAATSSTAPAGIEGSADAQMSTSTDAQPCAEADSGTHAESLVSGVCRLL